MKELEQRLAEQVSKEVYDTIASGDVRQVMVVMIENMAGLVLSMYLACKLNGETDEKELKSLVDGTIDLLRERIYFYISDMKNIKPMLDN